MVEAKKYKRNAVACFVSAEGLLPDSLMESFHCVLHPVERERELSGVFFIMALILFIRVLPS